MNKQTKAAAKAKAKASAPSHKDARVCVNSSLMRKKSGKKPRFGFPEISMQNNIKMRDARNQWEKRYNKTKNDRY